MVQMIAASEMKKTTNDSFIFFEWEHKNEIKKTINSVLEINMLLKMWDNFVL